MYWLGACGVLRGAFFFLQKFSTGEKLKKSFLLNCNAIYQVKKIWKTGGDITIFVHLFLHRYKLANNYLYDKLHCADTITQNSKTMHLTALFSDSGFELRHHHTFYCTNLRIQKYFGLPQTIPQLIQLYSSANTKAHFPHWLLVWLTK